MSEETDDMPGGTDEIEALLADRQRIQDWLDRLETIRRVRAGGVRRRVRADYEGRLAEVVVRLSGFTTALSESLAAVRSQLDGSGAAAVRKSRRRRPRPNCGMRSGSSPTSSGTALAGTARRSAGACLRRNRPAGRRGGRLAEVLAQVAAARARAGAEPDRSRAESASAAVTAGPGR